MNEKKIKDLINNGYSISEIAESLNIPKGRVYYVAKKYKLSFNNPIISGGSKEKRIIRLHKSGFSSKDIGRIFNQAPINIDKIIEKHFK